MLSEYPLQIQSASFNLMSMMSAGSGGDRDEGSDEVNVIQMITDLFSAQDSNDLAALKQYLDGEGSGIRQYVNSIEYIYDVVPQLYRPVSYTHLAAYTHAFALMSIWIIQNEYREV